MSLAIIDFPASPECSGTQWAVKDMDELAYVAALTLVGRAKHAARILNGAHRQATQVAPAMKQQLRSQLFPAPGSKPWHRDGLLFEILCWIAARITAKPDDVVSDPHLKSTQQGVDSIKVSFDPIVRSLTLATVYEYKCTDNPRKKFREEVLPAFQQYADGSRDNELIQTVLALLDEFRLTEEEELRSYDILVQQRPLAYEAALTVTPTSFDTTKCLALFKDFSDLRVAEPHRIGDTFPVADVRNWFEEFASKIWEKVEELDV